MPAAMLLARAAPVINARGMPEPYGASKMRTFLTYAIAND
jgi:hypothetical protein